MKNHTAAFLLGTALLVPGLGLAQDHDRDHQNTHKYEHRSGHDSHEWNAQEDQAYRRYMTESHKKYRDFSKVNQRDQERYWQWRHQHMDDNRSSEREHR